ncbi:Transcription factor ste11 [Madurella fahalii]|uniref:Transcription factor ste11 n=1 Tax=Madurella fahalii TaxID=1157608 RepID=A0ABQ0G0C5_9PEZI
MDRTTPPSPAPVKADALPAGFNDLLQHNAAASYPRETANTESVHADSQPISRYGTPTPQAHHPQGFDTPMAYQQRGGGGQLPSYHQQAMYPQDNSPYGPIPEPYSTPATSPPTPSHGLDIMAARSGSMARNDIGAKVLAPRSGRIEKAAPKKKKERAKPPKNVPVLDKPMSELTKGSSIPVADIEQYVNRSSEVRQQEVEMGKNPGRVKRPMNAFMLYRKAYQQRAKEWASQHNHQVVSRVCGLSWPLEPEHIRQQFKSWADMERDNHQKAHPNYKFTPSKPHKPTKFDEKFDNHSDGSDLEDYDWTGRSGSRMRSATHTPHDEADYLHSQAAYAATHPLPHQLVGMHGLGMMQQRPGFDFSQGKSMAAGYDHRELPGQYYETHIGNPQQRHLHSGMVEDALMHKSSSPSMVFQQLHAGQHLHYELGQFQTHGQGVEQSAQSQHQHQHQHQQPQHQQPQHQQPQQHNPHAPHYEHRIDPSLLPHEEALFDSSNYNSIPNLFDGGLGGAQQAWQPTQLVGNEPENQFSHAFLGLDETLSLEQHAQYLRGADEWQIEPLPDTTQFDTSWAEPKVEP